MGDKETDMDNAGINRRQFLKEGVVVGGLAAFAALGLAGCTDAGSGAKDQGGTGSAEGVGSKEESKNVSETIDCDIVVVGAGMSGLSASVQASENGDNVVTLEAGGLVGGAGNGVEGCFGVDSPMQIEQGIHLDKALILRNEVKKAGYAVSGLMWDDLISNSAQNIQWMIDNGVEFSGTIDGYMPGGEVTTFHWFKDGHAKDGYVSQMEAKAKANGVQFIFNTAAKELITDGAGKVIGLYAIKSDETYLQVNAKAVILCAGGYIGNEDLLSQQMNISPGEVSKACLEVAKAMNRMGDGMLMAQKVGAKPYPLTCIEGGVQPEGIPCGDASQSWTLMITDKVNWRTLMGPLIFMNVSTVWVEEGCQRFVNEGIGAESADELAIAPRKFCKEQYQVFDQKWVDTAMATTDLKEAFVALMETYPDTIAKADSIEELGNTKGLDGAALKATIDRYNGYCANGKDEDFGKQPEFLVALDTPPYYLFKSEIMGDATLGGVCTDRHFRALTAAKEPIVGLYVAGVDGAMLYNCTYTISMPGSACANSVNSGRTSANHAHDYIANA
jgi:fumarate reductase flavoprotein subunit